MQDGVVTKLLTLVVIVLTKTSDSEVHKMTVECIHSLLVHANTSLFSISVVVVESNQNSTFTYPESTRTLTPKEPFNFHRFLNLGILSEPAADWYLLCNNDLLFLPDWLKEIELVIASRPDFGSLSPISPTCMDQRRYMHSNGRYDEKYVIGYDRRKQLSGWCIMVKGETLKIIGKLDERFDFYFADDDYSLLLRRLNILHALVLKSKVIHLEDKKTSADITQSIDLTKYKKPIPKIIFQKRYSWLMSSEKMIDGYLIYTNKWGDMRLLSLKKKLHDIFFLKMKITAISRLLFSHK